MHSRITRSTRSNQPDFGPGKRRATITTLCALLFDDFMYSTCVDEYPLHVYILKPVNIRTCELRGEFLPARARKQRNTPRSYGFGVMFGFYVSHRLQYLIRHCVLSIRTTLAYVHRTRPTPSSCRSAILIHAIPS